eukprot:CAMPEP_0170544496 /NCGR_PEP_ID=MMETSP0211-20121228/3234_1 /TAXON_ID=311385 /ORGANISM="Pseudokeronopsis sp., Strain OXSARD2" /LENGTH=176 /DNA_ID=CAMNT_0010848155 /DNA_START=1 /DNA_END=531 /DNA_ORIENTATION=-
MIVYVLVLALIAAVLYFTLGKGQEDPPAPKDSPKEPPKGPSKEEKLPEENKKSAPGISFKQLKKGSGGGKKGKGLGGNPEHPAFVSAFKGLRSAVVDYDYFIFEDSSMVLVVAEEQSAMKVFFVRDVEKEAEFLSLYEKLPAGTIVVSLSVGVINAADSSQFSLMIAVASFDQCKV